MAHIEPAEPIDLLAKLALFPDKMLLNYLENTCVTLGAHHDKPDIADAARFEIKVARSILEKRLNGVNSNGKH